jgi:predicted RNA binding protein YcfA (HicA-like mRNA interferase family)
VKLPRDLSGLELARALSKVGYTITRQTGSHLRLTRAAEVQHHVTVPSHDPLKVGTLAAILNEVAAHLKVERETLAEKLFG